MKTTLLLIITFSVSSCASTSLSRSIGYSAGLGCAAGGATGYVLSPEGNYNKKANTAIFCAVGALISGAIGYFMYTDNPLNETQKRSIDGSLKIKNEVDMGTSSLNINQNFKAIGTSNLPQIHLPENIINKMPTPKIYVQEVEEQRVNKDGNYILIEPHKAYIYTNEEKK